MPRSVPTVLRFAPVLAILIASGCVSEEKLPGGPPAREVVGAAVDAMGGEALLRGLESLRIEGFSIERGVGIAESPAAAPLFLRDFSELRDLDEERALQHVTFRMPMRPSPLPVTRVLHADSGSVEDREMLELAPERIALRALDAPGLVARPDTTLEGRPARVVEFGAEPVRLYVDAETALPLAWSAVRAYPRARFTWAPWGEVTTRVTYFGWSLEPNGLRYPYGWNVERNGVRFRRVTITRVEPGAAVAADSFPSPEAPPAAPPADEQIAEIAPGVVFLSGSFNVVVVRQPDGVVVIEAPGSVERSREVIDEIERRFPGTPVKAVVVTDRVWPHMAGLLEYVERGVAVYAPPAAEETIRAMMAAHGVGSDGLDLRIVEARDAIGTGPDRVTLWRPAIIGAPRASRSLVAWLPGPEILHVGDLWIPERFEPNFWRASRREVGLVVDRVDGTPRRVVALHGPPLDPATARGEIAAAD